MSDDNEIVESTETEQAEVEQPEITAETGETAEKEGESATPPGDDAAASKPKKKGVQERIDELTRQRHEKERALETARQEAEYWKAQVVQKPQEQQPQSGAPAVEQFDSYEDYLRAAARYEVAQTLAAERQEQTAAQQRQKLLEQQRIVHEKGDSIADDFVEVVYNPELVISQEVAELAFDSEKGAEILYYLGKNPSESERISRLSPVAAAREIGRLEASLSMPAPKLTTSAPPPIKSISGGGEPPQMDQDKMTPEQWRDWRNEQLRKKGAR